MLKLPLLSLTLVLAGGLAVPALAGGRGGTDRLDQADANHDGVVTRAEFLAAREARLARMDRNRDGAVSADELPGVLIHGERGERLRATLSSADLDHDGRVTREEMARAPAPAFDRADADHDGRIDRAEMAAARAAPHSRGGETR